MSSLRRMLMALAGQKKKEDNFFLDADGYKIISKLEDNTLLCIQQKIPYFTQESGNVRWQVETGFTVENTEREAKNQC